MLIVLDADVSSFLGYLGVERQGPDLDFLNVLVRQSTSLSNDTLTQHFHNRREVRNLTDDELLYWLEHKFGLVPQIYVREKQLRRKWMKHFGLEQPTPLHGQIEMEARGDRSNQSESGE